MKKQTRPKSKNKSEKKELYAAEKPREYEDSNLFERRDGSKVLTKQLPLEILLHGVVVANEDVASKNLVPWQHLCRWQCLETLIGICIVAVIAAVVIVIVAATAVLVGGHDGSAVVVVVVVGIALVASNVGDVVNLFAVVTAHILAADSLQLETVGIAAVIEAIDVVVPRIESVHPVHAVAERDLFYGVVHLKV